METKNKPTWSQPTLQKLSLKDAENSTPGAANDGDIAYS